MEASRQNTTSRQVTKKVTIVKEEVIHSHRGVERSVSKSEERKVTTTTNKAVKGKKKKKSKERENVQIVYESEDAHAADAFKKYMLFQDLGQGKAGGAIKEMVENADYYLQNFKASRDSEFSEYDDIDILKLHLERDAIIAAINESQRNLDIYKRKLNNRGTKKREDGYDPVDDLEANQEDDEDRLIELYQKKQENRAKMAEELRERQQKLMQINEQIRKYDLRYIKQDEMDRLRNEIQALRKRWEEMRHGLEGKLKFIEKVHRRHHEEVDEYMKFSEQVDATEFAKKMKKLTFELQVDEKEFNATAESLAQARNNLKVFLERAKRDLEEEDKQNKYLKQRLIELDGTKDQANENLRSQIEQMKNEMMKINNYSIDMANNPAQAIKKISDPILDLMTAKIDDYVKTLNQNLSLKKDTQSTITDYKNKIFEEKTKQINIRRKREEIVYDYLDMKEDITIIQDQIQENVKRKQKLANKIEITTEQFKNEHEDLQNELQRVKAKLVTIFNHREKVEDQAEYLLHDRGNIGDPRKYELSIQSFLAQALDLEKFFNTVPDRIMRMHELLKIDPLYVDKRGKPRDIKVYYAVGRYHEKDKNETMINDIQSTQEYIQELLLNKENLEEQLSSFGILTQLIYQCQKTFKEVQEDIKLDIKKYIREKNQLMRYLETMGQDFEQNREMIGLQEGKIRKQQAKYKAIYFLLQEKMLKIRILEDELFKIKRIIDTNSNSENGGGGFERKPQEPNSKRPTEEAIAYEKEVVTKINKEKAAKDQEIAQMTQLLSKKDQEIERYAKLVEERGHMMDQEEVLIEEKAKAILERNGYNGSFERIAKQTYKIGDICFAYLKLKKEAIENLLMVKSSFKGDAAKKLRGIFIDGDLFYEFEIFVRTVIANRNE